MSIPTVGPFDRPALCPFCGRPNNSATFMAGAGGRDVPPAPGDASLCMGCGGLAVFTGQGLELREPTRGERAELLADPAVADVVAAWTLARLEGRT